MNTMERLYTNLATLVPVGYRLLWSHHGLSADYNVLIWPGLAVQPITPWSRICLLKSQTLSPFPV